MSANYLKGILKYDMPNDLRYKIENFIESYNGNNEELDLFIKEVRKRRSYTAPRKEIDWFPTIDKDKCTTCFVCYEFCPKGVYSLSSNGGIQVENPYECVMMCCGCKKKCPSNAIEFPKKQDFEKYIYYK